MYDSEKTSRFLKAIDKHTKKQQFEILEEIKKIEKKELEKAEAELIEEVRIKVQRELEIMRNKISIEISHKELDERKKIAYKRYEMVKAIFQESENRLIEYTRSKEYREGLFKDAQNIAQKLRGPDVVLYVFKEDLKYSDIIKKGFGRECRVVAGDDIKVGGIRGYSKKDKLIVDNTIDAELYTQEDWFLNKYGDNLVQEFLN